MTTTEDAQQETRPGPEQGLTCGEHTRSEQARRLKELPRLSG